MKLNISTADHKRTTPHECQQCGLCCQGRGDLWGDEDRWPTDFEPDDCMVFDKSACKCTVHDQIRPSACEDYPWDEWCERELKEKGLWEESTP